jgi:signal transduction histidine kinase
MARKPRARRSGYTIMVVDDQAEARTSVRRLLEREGHRVLTADCGDHALTLFKQQHVDLILVDHLLPRMTSEELVREIRRLDPFVQIILLTSCSSEKPPRVMVAELDIQGCHDTADGPEKLRLWVDVGLKAQRMIRGLQERERVHSELVANVSHEFRTPLNIIGGYTSLLLDGTFGTLPSAAVAPLRSMSDATDSLTELVSDFLNYSHLEARPAKINRQWIATRQLAHELERLGTVLLEGKEVRFELDLREAPAAVLTDLVKLRTVLRNLITNAVKFTATGSIVVRIARRENGLCFSVQDTGTGIHAADLAVVFEPFRQLKTTSAKGNRGIGLGLALSRKLARVLGGDLEVQSQPGVGSIFTLVLPPQTAVSRDRLDDGGCEPGCASKGARHAIATG